MSEPEKLIFHLGGDDHEERVYSAATEEEARSKCADGFNEQYHDAEYEGWEFDLIAVYRNTVPDEYIDEDNIDDSAGDLERLDSWP